MWKPLTGATKHPLHLFEHVHGDSRERGPALIDLLQTYEKAGLQFKADELPDHLPVVLERHPPSLLRWRVSSWARWRTS